MSFCRLFRSIKKLFIFKWMKTKFYSRECSESRSIKKWWENAFDHIKLCKAQNIFENISLPSLFFLYLNWNEFLYIFWVCYLFWYPFKMWMMRMYWWSIILFFLILLKNKMYTYIKCIYLFWLNETHKKNLEMLLQVYSDRRKEEKKTHLVRTFGFSSSGFSVPKL